MDMKELYVCMSCGKEEWLEASLDMDCQNRCGSDRLFYLGSTDDQIEKRRVLLEQMRPVTVVDEEGEILARANREDRRDEMEEDLDLLEEEMEKPLNTYRRGSSLEKNDYFFD